MLQECSSWASRNDVVLMFCLTQNIKMLSEKFAKSEMFLAALREHIISNVNRVEVHKMGEIF